MRTDTSQAVSSSRIASHPLFKVLETGDLKAAKHYLQRGADVNVRNEYRWTPLHAAARVGSLEIADSILLSGGEIDSRDDDERTPLYHAASAGDDAMVTLLLKRGARADLKQKAYGATPMHVAAYLGRFGVVEILASHGAEVNAENHRGQTSLHLAARTGRSDVAQLLLSRGARTDQKDHDQLTPIHHAIEWNHPELAKLLADSRHRASFSAHPQAARRPALSAEFPGPLDEESGKNPEQILFMNIKLGNLEKIRDLLRQGLNVNLQDDYGWTPLHLAAREGRPETAKLLLEHGAWLDAMDYDFITPLYRAASAGHAPMVELFIDRGARIENKRKGYGATPLHVAAWRGNVDEIEVLLRHGADARATNHAGETPLDLAEREGQTAAVDLLLRFPAKIQPMPLKPQAPHLIFRDFLKSAENGNLELFQKCFDANAAEVDPVTRRLSSSIATNQSQAAAVLSRLKQKFDEGYWPVLRSRCGSPDPEREAWTLAILAPDGKEARLGGTVLFIRDAEKWKIRAIRIPDLIDLTTNPYHALRRIYSFSQASKATDQFVLHYALGKRFSSKADIQCIRKVFSIPPSVPDEEVVRRHADADSQKKYGLLKEAEAHLKELFGLEPSAPRMTLESAIDKYREDAKPSRPEIRF